MPTPRFNLKNKTDPEPLILYIQRIRGERFVYSTGLRCPVKYWDTKRGRVKSPHLYRPGSGINDVLSKMEEAGQAFYSEGMAAGRWDWARLREELDRLTLRSSAPSGLVVDFIEKVAQERKGKVKKNTAQNYDSLVFHLCAWQKVNATRLHFSEVDMVFFYSFTTYLRNRAGLSENSVRAYIVILKTFLREAEQRGVELPADYRSKLFSVKATPTYHIYLTEDEVRAIADAVVPDDLAAVRDAFLLGCRTGQRFSDWSQVVQGNVKQVDGVEVVYIRQTKTGAEVAVPVHADVRAVWNRWPAGLPIPSNQDANTGIKEVCRLAGIDRAEQVMTHTARRTFCTLAFKAGIPPLSIAKMSGHAGEKVLLQYIRMSSTENAAQVGRHRFFGNEKGPDCSGPNHDG